MYIYTRRKKTTSKNTERCSWKKTCSCNIVVVTSCDNVFHFDASMHQDIPLADVREA